MAARKGVRKFGSETDYSTDSSALGAEWNPAAYFLVCKQFGDKPMAGGAKMAPIGPRRGA